MNTITSNSPLFQRSESPSAEAYVVDETDTVDRFFPRPVNLTLPGHVVRKFPAGFQAVPRQLADDPWLKLNGVVEPPRAGEPLPLQPQAPVGSHGHATAFAQSGVYDATMVPRAVPTDSDIEAADTIARAAAENVRVAREILDNALSVHQNAVGALNSARETRASDEADREDRAKGGAGRPDSVVNTKSRKRENSQERRAREKREEDFYDTLSVEDKARWDDSTQDERDNWIAQGPKA